ncbi:hypothetical protein CR159_11525 [Pollutimonas subterranea]|uniref:RES domain-containing protein n=1 Tax=Pollutimonas subterranea TaxID=2045210 RepID=A0A2N4U3H2_9BURK|nr:RES family NAD+ phosphorylase [Pollutimonas subterranea]PLC49565.1 hypothetical protein CR159_11525 [Pollutimonas subterranea]
MHDLPDPPLTPPGDFQLIERQPRVLFRIHSYDGDSGKYAADQFNDSGLGNARFSPLRCTDTGAIIPTLYAADSERGAIAEVLLHDLPRPSAGYIHDLERDLQSTLHLSSLFVLCPLRVINLTSLGMSAAGLAPFALSDGQKTIYPRTRAWALWIWEHYPNAQGLYWTSQRDSTAQAYMLFGDRVNVESLKPNRTHPISAYENDIVTLLAEAGAAIAPNI